MITIAIGFALQMRMEMRIENSNRKSTTELHTTLRVVFFIRMHFCFDNYMLRLVSQGLI